MSDDELLKGLARGDPRAFVEFEKRYKEIVFFQVKKDLYFNTEDTGNEIYQEVLIAIWKKAHANDEIKNLPGYIYQICKNKIRDRMKTPKKNIPLIENNHPDDDSNAIEKILTKEEINLVYEIIRRLKPIERKIIRLFFEQELTSSEVGEMLNMNADTTKQRKKRALDKIRDALKNSDQNVTLGSLKRLNYLG